jgi:hypothetical protein
VIVALNVIPHTTNLKEILDYVGKLLNKNGIFIMEGAYFFETIFKGKKEGFFIDCGAFDGESLSNTLNLELKYVLKCSSTVNEAAKGLIKSPTVKKFKYLYILYHLNS